MKKIFLFDCDQTIWTSGKDDYISSFVSTLIPVTKKAILRKADGSVFKLNPTVRLAFKLIFGGGDTVGIISDNKPDVVINALRLFDIYKYVDFAASRIKLWKGPCPKEVMIREVLSKPQFDSVNPTDVYWFDDKDYSKEAFEMGVNFTKVGRNTDLNAIVKAIIH